MAESAPTVPDLPVTSLPGSTDRERLRRTEWLLTNGLGGYAMGTALGMPTRRYHALLVAAMDPPVQREVMLSALVETLVLHAGTEQERAIDLSCFKFAGGVEHPRGDLHLALFEKGPTFCRWTWRVEGVEVCKTLRLHRGANAANIAYTVGAGGGVTRLQLRPLVAMRDSHHQMHRHEAEGAFRVEAFNRGATVHRGIRSLVLSCDIGWFEHDEQWWYRFDYAHEEDRGYDHEEDLFSPGFFGVQARAGAAATMTITARIGPEPRPIADDEAAQRGRLRKIAERTLASVPGAPMIDRVAIARLAAAADDFVVQRGTGPDAGVSIIAGYPWFSDWGRDTMISLPGLLLATGRTDEARRVLETFAAHRRRGLIPNVFNDQSGAAEYNTVDASLWYLHAACAYLQATGDRAAFEGEIRRACLEIVEAYRDGTDFGIRADPADGLVTAGDETSQLTWMDAKRDGVVFTPRHGKAVEINALWVHGLRSLAAALERTEAPRASSLRALADRASASFLRAFWNGGRGCCYDVLIPGPGGTWTPDARVRPNQIFAASLEHSPLPVAQRRAVVAVVRERLLTPVGLRTLDPADEGYRGRFAGPMRERDAAYHNGTVWPWLIGPYAEAVLRAGAFSAAARAEARRALEPVLAQLDGEAIGQLPEVYDGDDEPGRPRRPGGCIAQAWSVAEALRALLLTLRA